MTIKRKEMLMKNIEFIGYHDLNKKPGFQMALHKSGERYYLYTASYRHNGVNIVDVTDPYHPRTIKWMEGLWLNDELKDGQGIPKIQVADGKMILAHGGNMDILHGTSGELPFWGGVSIWDIKTNPEEPTLLGKFQSNGPGGVHRFCYNGGRYVYVTGATDGYKGFILRIVDIENSREPKEVGRWFMSEQYLGDKIGSGNTSYGSPESMASPFIHANVYKDDIVYCACPNKGFVMVDVKDKTNPQIINCLPLNPPFGGGSAGAAVHSVLPLGERPYAVVTTEGERIRYFSNENKDGWFKKIVTQPMAMIGIVELTDIKNPSLISVFPYPEVPEGYTHGGNFNIVDGVRCPFGPHNLFDVFGQDVYEKRDDRVYCCYFNAGLRIYDVSDPFIPKEIAYFLPPDPEEKWFDNNNHTLLPGPEVAVTEDVLVDDRGYIYLDTFSDGLYIVKCTV